MTWTLVALGVAFLLLVGTGLWLIWHFRPTPVSGWFDPNGVEVSVLWSRRVRIVHHGASIAFVWLGIALFVESIVWAATARRVRHGLTGFMLMLAGAFASFTGFLLPWDQLALWSITVDQDGPESFSGYRFLFDDNVRYAVIGAREISLATLRRWFWVHTAVIPVILITLGVGFLVLVRRRSIAIGSPAGPDVDVTEERPWH